MTTNQPLSYGFLFASLLLLYSGCAALPHPSDKLLISRFNEHRADFEKLVRMLDEDREVILITKANVFLAKGVIEKPPRERIEEYRRLFGELHLEGGVQREHQTLIFTASMRGVILANSAKAYTYSVNSPPGDLVDSLDVVIGRNPRDQKPVYRKIAENWYLVYESW